MTDQSLRFPRFYLTVPAPCPYLDGRVEQKIFTELKGLHADELNDSLSRVGFRRSQSVAYKPACDGCSACVSVRIPVDRFEWTRSWRRIWKRNSDLQAKSKVPQVSMEQFALLRSYLDTRHPSGGMAGMSVLDFAAMVEETPVKTQLVEYRTGRTLEPEQASDGRLIATSLTDILSDGLSMIYSFYEPSAHNRSLGSYMILQHIDWARKLGLPYVYLGYWIDGSPKMDYKARFRPLEMFVDDCWQELEA